MSGGNSDNTWPSEPICNATVLNVASYTVHNTV